MAIITAADIINEAKNDRTLAVNAKVALIQAEVDSQAKDNYLMKFINGDTIKIGLGDLIWYHYREKQIEIGDSFNKPYLSTLPTWRTSFSTLFSNALSPVGDGEDGFYPGDSNSEASKTLNFSSPYLNANGEISIYTTYSPRTASILGFCKSILDAIGYMAVEIGDTYSGYTFTTSNQARDEAFTILYGTPTAPGTVVHTKRLGSGLYGRRTQNTKVTTESAGSWRWRMGADGVVDSPNFYADSSGDTDGFLGDILYKTNLKNALYYLATNGDSMSAYYSHLKNFRQQMVWIQGDSNEYCKAAKPDIGDSVSKIDSVLSVLDTYIGDANDVVGDSTIWGYYNFFNTAVGNEANFNLYLNNLRKMTNNICMLYGDCETLKPRLNGQTGDTQSNCTFESSTDFKRSEANSFKFTKTIAAGTEAVSYPHSHKTATTTNMAGLKGGDTLELSAWFYIPAASNIAGTECILGISDYVSSWQDTEVAATNVYDTWQKITVTRTIRLAATGVVIKIKSASTAALGEYFYVDDIEFPSSRNIYGKIANRCISIESFLGGTGDSEAAITKERKQRLFWIKQIIGKPKSSRSNFLGSITALGNANLQLVEKDNALNTLLGNSLTFHLQFIPTPIMMAAYPDPKALEDGTITKHKISIAFTGQQHATAYYIYRQQIPAYGTYIYNTPWVETYHYATQTNTDEKTGAVLTSYTDSDPTFGDTILTPGSNYVYRVRIIDEIYKVNGDTTGSIMSDIFDATTAKPFTAIAGDSYIHFGDSHKFTANSYIVINNTISSDGYYKILKKGDDSIKITPVISENTSGTAYKCPSVCFLTV